MAFASPSVVAKGFCTDDGDAEPAASSTKARWLGAVVAMSTKSGCSVRSISPASA